METYAALAKPGKAHNVLEPLIGAWDIKSTAWMPGAPEPIVTTGTVTKSWALGGRFVHEDLRSMSPMGQAYTGIGYLGHDNNTRVYQGVWMSDGLTGMTTYSGVADASGMVFTFTGVEHNALGGNEALEFRVTLTIESKDRHVLLFEYLLSQGPVKAFMLEHSRKR